MKKRRILVTGGAGFIGSNLVDRLIKLGNTVTVFDNLETGLKKYVNSKAFFVKGDVTNERDVKKLFQKNFDVVCHVAGRASAINSFLDVHGDAQTNYIGTINIVKASLAKKIPRFLYASSMTTYGKTETLPISEDTACRPVSYYGISKYAAERFVHASADRVDLDFPFSATSFRMFNVYGPRQSLTNPYQGVMAIIIGNVIRNEPINIFGDGKQSRDFVFIDDVVDVWIKSIDKKETIGKVLNIGLGKNISINNLADTIIRAFGYNPKTYKKIYKKARPGEQRHMQADISRLKRSLKITPQHSLEEGLKKTISWAKKTSI